MPDVSRLFVKTSLMFFVLTFASGGLFLVYQAFGRTDISWGFIAAHTHAGTVGWLALMVMGVAYWMFPLDKKRFEDGRGRYHRGLALTTYWLVSGGLVLRILVEPVATRGAGGPLNGLLAISGIAQAAGAVLFVWEIWSRVRGIGTGS
jgi:cbb3-type cytochrome oxidase subunit 1